MQPPRPVVCLGIVILLSAKASLGIEPVSFFRADRGRAIGGETLPSDLGASRNLVWRCELPPGHSSPCLAGERILVTAYREAEQELVTVAVDREQGRIVWQQAAPQHQLEAFHRTGSPAAATVAWDGQQLYSFFGSWGLLCYGPQGDGRWNRSLGPFQDEFGAASSPVVVGDLVVLNQDHDANNALYAFDRRTGELVWRAARDEFTRSYSTPVVAEIDGETQLVVAGALTLTGYAAATGERRWWIHGLARIVNTTPLIEDGIAYVATWSPGGDAGERISMESWAEAAKTYDKDMDGKIQQAELGEGEVLTRFFRIDVNQDGGLDQAEWERQAAVFELARNSVMAVRLGGRGELAEDRVLWRYERGIPYVASPLLVKRTLYLIKDGGILTSLDADTGERIKQSRIWGRGNYYASPVYADGKIYLASDTGDLTVVSAQGEWTELAQHSFEEPIYATPVVAHGNLYVRTAAALYCFRETAP